MSTHYVNTKHLTQDELRPALKERARDMGIDLFDPSNRFTIWSENGTWSTGAKHVLFEDSAGDESERRRKAADCMVKTGYSRTFILNALRDQVEVLPARSVAVVFIR
jgi:hypothetical protein